MMGYNFEILYRNGSSNVVADALSQAPQVRLNAMTVCTSDLLARIKHSWLQDPSLIHLLHKLKQQTRVSGKYSWQNGQL